MFLLGEPRVLLATFASRTCVGSCIACCLLGLLPTSIPSLYLCRGYSWNVPAGRGSIMLVMCSAYQLSSNLLLSPLPSLWFFPKLVRMQYRGGRPALLSDRPVTNQWQKSLGGVRERRWTGRQCHIHTGILFPRLKLQLQALSLSTETQIEP